MFRELGATAREMFKATAAAKFKIPASSLTAEHGHIVHAASGRSLSFAALAEAAARQPPPNEVTLKPKAQWTLMGTSAARLDTPAKVDGSAGFGVDVILPDLLVATIQAAPVFTARLLSVDPAPAMKIPGVQQVVALDNAVAVVATGYWPALRGLKTLAPVWDTPARAHYGASDLALDLESGLNRANAPVLQSIGDVDSAMKAAARTAVFEYTVPYLTHACMEPMNATAHVRADSVDIWMPGQGHTTVIEGVAKALSIDPLSIHVHRTFLGGGFGRRGEGDVAVQAALIAKQVGRPVKLIWSREEDIRQDFYRPAAKMRIMAGLDANNLPVALDISNAVPSISKRRFPDAVKDGKDMSALAAFNDSPYAIAHSRMRFGLVDNGIPVGYWRSVNHSQNVFFREPAINELAARAKQDGLTFRKALLAGNTRILTLLDALIRLAAFDKPMAAGIPGTRRGRGAALSTSHGSIVAQVVEVSVAADNAITIDRVSCVADVGTIVNPGIVSAQMESSIIDGLSAAMFGGMTPKNGGMAEGNFSELRFMRLAEAPEMRVEVRDWPEAAPGGVGEPGLPPVAPALIAALAQATGVWLRTLPVVKQGFSV
ncbi:MAG: xanthine dehydrogenase family protein molybdopterin-binding subunit [Rhodospirillaceae bacterium]|nr:xanthine dehydrogenase family protein molybdopterin-binding subunit [Rhodospirillaceae bacterium]